MPKTPGHVKYDRLVRSHLYNLASYCTASGHGIIMSNIYRKLDGERRMKHMLLGNFDTVERSPAVHALITRLLVVSLLFHAVI